MTPEFLDQLEMIRGSLALYADEMGLWAIVHALDEVLQRYGRR